MDNTTTTTPANERAWYGGFTAAYASVCTFVATDDVEVAWAAFAEDESDVELHAAFVVGWADGLLDATIR